VPFLHRPRRLRLHHEGRRDAIRHDVAEPQEHARHDDLKQGVKHTEPPARKAILEQIRDRRQPDAPEPDVHEPEVRIHEDGLERKPRPRGTLLEHEACGAHRTLRLGGVPEVQKKLIEFSQLSAGQKKPFLRSSGLGGTFADPHYGEEIGDNDGKIENVQAADGH